MRLPRALAVPGASALFFPGLTGTTALPFTR